MQDAFIARRGRHRHHRAGVGGERPSGPDRGHDSARTVKEYRRRDYCGLLRGEAEQDAAHASGSDKKNAVAYRVKADPRAGDDALMLYD